MSDPKSPWPQTSAGAFATTQWTVILDAANRGEAESSAAFSKLCETYWPPVYAFIRHRGNAPEDAKDLTQGFFVHLLEKRPFANADRKKGKFRTYLLGAVKFFLSDAYDKANAQKRGGGALHFSIDANDVETLLGANLYETTTPEVLFERQWVVAIMGEAETSLREEYAKKGKEDTFDMLVPFLLEERGERDISYQELAARHAVTDASLRMAANRMRKRYGQILREKVAATVESPEEIESEVRHLLSAMQSG